MSWFFNNDNEDRIRELEYQCKLADQERERAWSNYDYDDADSIRKFDYWNEKSYELDQELQNLKR